MRDGEATMGCLAHTRAVLLRRDTGGAIDFTFNQGIFWMSNWIVPKGNPAGKRVWTLFAATQDPHGRSGAPVSLVLITYAATEASIRSALEKISGDGLIAEPPQVIRIERE